MPRRPVPDELASALHVAAELEALAVGRAQRNAAALGTTRVLIAALDAGWRISEVATIAGLKRTTAEKRVEAARRRGLDGSGIDVPAPPASPPPSRPSLLRVPAAEREWLTASEAARMAGVDRSTIARWSRAGVLPNTWWIVPSRPLYLRADVIRLLKEPRWRNNGVNLAVARDAVTSGPTR